MKPRVGCAVLAAGCSARLGRPKQLVVFEGETLVRRAVSAACASLCDDVVAILGAYAPLVEGELAGSRAQVVKSQWRMGIGASIAAAAQWSHAHAHDALVLAVCDQPRLTREPLDALVNAWLASSPESSVASVYSGVLGVPALFPGARFHELMALDPSRGASALLRGAANVVQVAWPDGALDVDTESDLERLLLRGDGAETA
jgi:molybdenum cofactor cytidylyltransferase